MQNFDNNTKIIPKFKLITKENIIQNGQITSLHFQIIKLSYLTDINKTYITNKILRVIPSIFLIPSIPSSSYSTFFVKYSIILTKLLIKKGMLANKTLKFKKYLKQVITTNAKISSLLKNDNIEYIYYLFKLKTSFIRLSLYRLLKRNNKL